MLYELINESFVKAELGGAALGLGAGAALANYYGDDMVNYINNLEISQDDNSLYNEELSNLKDLINKYPDQAPYIATMAPGMEIGSAGASLGYLGYKTLQKINNKE